VCEWVWEAGRCGIFPSVAAALCVAYVGLNERPPLLAWKLVSRWTKEDREPFARWCGSEGSAQTSCQQPLFKSCVPLAVCGFSQCGVMHLEIKEREQIFDLGIKTIFRKSIYLTVEGIISTAGREFPSVCALWFNCQIHYSHLASFPCVLLLILHN